MKNLPEKVLLSALMLAGVSVMTIPVQSTAAVQEIKETFMLSGFLGENFDYMKKILRHAQEMQNESRPFTSKRHRDRYRFQPTDNHPREIMILARKIAARFKMINGLLYHSDIPNRLLLHQQILETIESISTYSKRAIRAINDNNYALHLASAQGIEKEVFTLNELLHSLEQSINANISETDATKESL